MNIMDDPKMAPAMEPTLPMSFQITAMDPMKLRSTTATFLVVTSDFLSDSPVSLR